MWTICSLSSKPLFNWWHLKQFGWRESLAGVELSKDLSVNSSLDYCSKTKERCLVDGLPRLLLAPADDPMFYEYSDSSMTGVFSYGPCSLEHTTLTESKMLSSLLLVFLAICLY